MLRSVGMFWVRAVKTPSGRESGTGDVLHAPPGARRQSSRPNRPGFGVHTEDIRPAVAAVS